MSNKKANKNPNQSTTRLIEAEAKTVAETRQ